jgi:gamma-glutamyltranspeptidase/glutathione hydrolase
MTRHVAVAATGPAAVDAGLTVVRLGGNAVDAAIAAMCVAMTTEPGVVSPMGGAFVTIWPPDGEPVTIDGNVEMPGRRATEEQFGQGLEEIPLAYGGGITIYAGWGSVALPGAVSALGLAHDRYGEGSWADALAPAEKAARQGFRLGAAAASYLALTTDSLFGWDRETHAALTRPDGSHLEAGDRMVDPALADSWRLIAQNGAGEVYTGEIGRALARASTAGGGLITEADLAAYRPVVRTPLRLDLGQWDIATNPPPSVGGPMLAVMLGELVRRGALAWGDVIEVQRQVLTYRSEVHDFSGDLEEDGYRLLEEVRTAGLAGITTSSETAHVSAVDSDGLACAITASSGYSSGATIPGTGLVLNNCLGEPELNRLGLHALPPGTRLASNMAPSVARHRSGDVLAIGTPGADRITTALMQVLSRHCLLGMPLGEAIAAPRVHVRVVKGEPTRVEHEPDPAIAAAIADLHLTGNEHARHAMFFGGVGGASRSATGVLSAAGDPRREAATGVA